MSNSGDSSAAARAAVSTGPFDGTKADRRGRTASSGRASRDAIRCTCPYCQKEFYIDRPERPLDPGDGSVICCNKCGFVWKKRTENPVKCPKCGSYAWNKPTEECSCKVCGYEWITRKAGGPARCPNCKSSRWNEEPAIVEKKVEDVDPEDVRKKWILERYDRGMGCLDIAAELGIPLFSVMRIVKDGLGLQVFPRM